MICVDVIRWTKIFPVTIIDDSEDVITECVVAEISARNNFEWTRRKNW
jgi:hypothetical protein